MLSILLIIEVDVIVKKVIFPGIDWKFVYLFTSFEKIHHDANATKKFVL